MKTIHYFPLPWRTYPSILVPTGSELLHVAVINGEIRVFFLAGGDHSNTEWNFMIADTGDHIPSHDLTTYMYFDTVVDQGFEKHIFVARMSG